MLRNLLKHTMCNDSPFHGKLMLILLGSMTLHSGCIQGVIMKREQEMRCPTDIRQKVPWCAGEDAIFYCPCGPDGEFYGMRPTCWGEWPASGADWRDAFCGAASETLSTSPDQAMTEEAQTEEEIPDAADTEEITDEADTEELSQPEPVAAEDGEFYNPFNASQQTLPAPELDEESGDEDSGNGVFGDEVPDQPESEVPTQLPEVVPEPNEIPDNQGSINPLPEIHTQVIPPAPVADRPKELVLASLHQQARQIALEQDQEMTAPKISGLQASRFK
jgi:hypothetical protein